MYKRQVETWLIWKLTGGKAHVTDFSNASRTCLLYTSSLNEFEKELDDRFFRAGRSLIINLKYIRRVTKTEVSLSDGTLLPLPRGAYEPLNRAIIMHT